MKTSVAIFAVACMALAQGCPNIVRPVCELGDCIAYPAEVPINNCVSSCGPCPTVERIKILSPIVMPPTQGPLCVLPSPPLPPPVVISNKCACTKTVMKPELFQRVIQLQRNQNYLRKTFTPVVENMCYCARPL